MKGLAMLFLDLLWDAVEAFGDESKEDEVLMSAQEKIKAEMDRRAFAKSGRG